MKKHSQYNFRYFKFLSSNDEGDSIPKKTKITYLKFLITISWIIERYDENLEGIAQVVFPKKGKKHKTFKDWLNNKNQPNGSYIRQLDNEFKGCEEIFNHPLFTLLEPSLTSTQLRDIEKKYVVKKGLLKMWVFPAPRKHNPSFFRHYDYNDSELLLQKGGHWAFFAILALVRRAEFDSESVAHFTYMQYAYQAFPSLCREAGFKTYWPILFDCLRAVSYFMPMTPLSLKPKIEIINKQINAPYHSYKRGVRTKLPVLTLLKRPEEPFEIARFETNYLDYVFDY